MLPERHTNAPKPTENIKDGVLTLAIQKELYPLDVLFSASYVFIDRAYIFFYRSPHGEMVLTFEPKESISDEALRKMSGDFINELLAVRVRQTIADRNKTIREYIVSGVLGAAIGEEGTNFGGGLEMDVDLDALGVPLDEVPEEELKNTPTNPVP